jgi:5-formyltetrahydrofolate cyclo-ligase
MSKQRHEIRTEMRMVLSRLDKRWIQAASHDLCKRLSELVDNSVAHRIKHVLAWVSFFPGEVDLSSFISDQLGRREVYLPRVGTNRGMTFIQVERNWASSSETGAFGIPGPSSSASGTYDPAWAAETVVIVPGLAFDHNGNRLGRGKGYYNQFLQPPMSHAVKIGACWSLQMLSQVPTDSDHAVMDWICHERAALKTAAEFEGEL